MKARLLLLSVLFLSTSAFADDMLKAPYSVILSYTDKGGTVSTEAVNLARREVTLPLHFRGNQTWLASVVFNSSEALKGKGPADEDLNLIYITISNPAQARESVQNGSTTVSQVSLFKGEFKLQLGKKMNVYKTPDYSIDVTVVSDAEGKK